jgi:hypothetical protein
MSILVALTCPTCAAIAVDSRQITIAHTPDDTFEKSFKLQDGERTVIGGFVGILTTPSRSIRDCIDAAWPDARTLSDFAAACGAEMKNALQGFKEGTTLVLVGSKNLDGRGRPEICKVFVGPADGQTIDQVEPITQYILACGDPTAVSTVYAQGGWDPMPDKLRIDAESRIVAGIKATGSYQGIPACGGDPRSQVLLTVAEGSSE